METNPLDAFDLEAGLTSAEKSVRQSLRQFLDAKVKPTIHENFWKEQVPLKEWMRELGRIGVLGASFEGYGCPGLSNVAYGLLMQELERVDSGLRTWASVQGALAMNAIVTFGTEAQKKHWLPAMAKGEKIGCFGLTEPGAGSNPGGMTTRAAKTSAGYLLNGAKTWIGLGTYADVAVVWAKLDADDAKSIRGFLVERGTPGFSSTPIEGKFSLRTAVSCDLRFDNCELADSALLPLTDGLKSPLTCLNLARFGIAWGVIGAAQACFAEALDHAKTRVQFGQPIGGFQLVQAKLAQMAVKITNAQLMAFQLAHLKKAGALQAFQISMAKLNNVQSALEVARSAREILGGVGILDRYATFRHMNNLESVYTYEGTHDIHLLTVGRELTGIQSFF